MAKATNITWHETKIKKEDRRRLNGHSSAVLWFTGLSGAGKSTLSVAVEQELHRRGIRTYILDGDNIRHGLNKNLGFSPEDRKENIRRIGEVSKLFVDAGVMVLTAFISPYRADRDMVRELVEDNEFVEIYVNCPLEACEQRDPKGLYKKARNGEIQNFTGIDAPYEAPEHPELVVETDKQPLEQSVGQVIRFLEEKGYIEK
ncbi:MAG: adenylyl-sulfate kinase [Heyndrickxia faecalis]|jgi:adenylylsulfate kinase|uniref:Adenylyl-sulfate kinase n=3 Tax=Heyndrickxia TaxID=2837504 RepID=G2TI65_HEYCO|nr:MULTISPECIES: adenylyl-sulfate kinase [Heyndrickxia]AEP00340.1 adenylylsulfate kinase [Heyndrickxia coagulans 36D1]APB37924.1 adenylyl-sulfate kinase [Heyndrickxia coagulans]AVD54823.1 adenylyl-sulfate kinase [Heyndrickxia coagulans]AWP35679.1 adenylyl-sulfate kinase [Heyndrickxia coagulans]KWZ86453.1 adenylyl-sulfate kinase [Heyndrickxia coagulans]